MKLRQIFLFLTALALARQLTGADTTESAPVGSHKIQFEPSAMANESLVVETQRTGQTTSYAPGDDGDLQMGHAWPMARFVDNSDGTVTDSLTGLMWVKAPLSLVNNVSNQTWASALTFCVELAYAGHSDWRLPNVRELCSMLDYSQVEPAMPKGHPFVGVPTGNFYWTSSTYAENTNQAWIVDLVWGAAEYTRSKTRQCRVWPVRGGKRSASVTR